MPHYKKLKIMKKFIVIACLIPNIILGQENYKYFGTAYNESQGVGGPFFVELTINPDNSVIGYLDADQYPGQSAFCGAGDFSGTLNGNDLTFTFTVFDPDSGCGFINGWTETHNYTFSPNRQFIIGDYFIHNNNTTGDVYLRTENECVDIPTIEAIYQSKIGTPEELYAKQYLCLAQKTCAEYDTSGDDGWAGGFVRYMFDYMNTHNRGNTGLDFTCSPLISNERCFTSTGTHHLYVELMPAFFNYCKKIEDFSDIVRWTIDHEQFISQVVEECFDELNSMDCSLLPPILCEAYFHAAKKSTISSVRNLRLTAQANCTINLFNGNIFDLSDEMPESLVKDSIYSHDLFQTGDILLTTDTFFLKVGGSYQLSATLNDATSMDITSGSNGTQYYLNVDESIATITSDGLLAINGSSLPLVNSRLPLYILV
ncbi:MAG: hypothetical protein KDC72_09245, partial [Bacteroidetes bacterium]|nr:hypothetical protein [Bacteroidota bacterium]